MADLSGAARKASRSDVVVAPDRTSYTVKDMPTASGGSAVVIAPHENFPQLTRALGGFVGAGAVSDDVAEIDHHVMRGRGGQAGLQRFQVGVDVAENKNAHKRVRKQAKRAICAAHKTRRLARPAWVARRE